MSDPNTTSLQVGIDVGSTTVKVVALRDGQIVFDTYESHKADPRSTLINALSQLACELSVGDAPNDTLANVAMTGTGAMSLAKQLGAQFVQEINASATATLRVVPDADVVIDLGGEDGKITFFSRDGATEDGKPVTDMKMKMTGQCAAGTGAIIEQMATLLDTTPAGLNDLARHHSESGGAGNDGLVPISSRCGVFMKDDLQPQINRGVPKAVLATSVYRAVAVQSLGQLARGHQLGGKTVFLGGPLHYQDQLRRQFEYEITNRDSEATFISPENSHLFPAIGAALMASEAISLSTLVGKIEEVSNQEIDYGSDPPLFTSRDEYNAFVGRHEQAKVRRSEEFTDDLYLGIDIGSTTIKAALVNSRGELVWDWYNVNGGDILATVKTLLGEMYRVIPDKSHIASTVTTGYGGEFIGDVLHAEVDMVETEMHLRAAQEFMPDVDSIIDIGGKDAKFIRVRDKDSGEFSININDSCSSGSGAFLQYAARMFGTSLDDMVRQALFAEKPFANSTRCTIFMTSSVRAAQKMGVNPADIAAGLCYASPRSVMQKVIRSKNPRAALGEKIIVQGGTFQNDAVLRAFENLIGCEVVRPDISGCMGAYGAALTARDLGGERSGLPTADQLDSLRVSDSQWGLLSGSVIGGETLKVDDSIPNLVNFKYNLLFDRDMNPDPDVSRKGRVGIPRVLNMYEDFPFWHRFFTAIGFEVVLSDESSKELSRSGTDTVLSDNICLPAKLSHGHIINLFSKLSSYGRDSGLDFIFSPDVREERGGEFKGMSGHLNCPVIAGYSNLLRENVVPSVPSNIRSDIEVLTPSLPLYAGNDRFLAQRLLEEIGSKAGVSLAQIKRAIKAARLADQQFVEAVQQKGEETIDWLRTEEKKRSRHGIVLAGRPYHIDPLTNLGIPTLIQSLGFAVLTEDAISHLAKDSGAMRLRVRDQRAYHARLYRAAEVVGGMSNLDFVQLNSFGCGMDAFTISQVEDILESHHKLVTTLRIDDSSTLGANKIRLRSLRGAIKSRSDS
jgi:predicted CoA-substrate-specific enzyme activase